MLHKSNKKMIFHNFSIPAKVQKKALGCTPKALFFSILLCLLQENKLC